MKSVYSLRFAEMGELVDFRLRALAYLQAGGEQAAAIFDSNAAFCGQAHRYEEGRFEWVLAAGAHRHCVCAFGEGGALSALSAFLSAPSAAPLCPVLLSYELKDEVEPHLLHSKLPDALNMPLVFAFEPQKLLWVSRKSPLRVDFYAESAEKAAAWAAEIAEFAPLSAEFAPQNLPLQARLSRAEYARALGCVRGHIVEGDVYELNFCQEFFMQPFAAEGGALPLYERLNRQAQTPFAGYFSMGDGRYLCSASPERFLYKSGSRLLSQPIKGTRRRNLSDKTADEALRQELKMSEKDRAENLMIVDLVRNDLARICQKGSVQATELCALYAFPSVWQMVSSIKGRLQRGANFEQILRATFPMGSMTGAPKIAAMQYIEQLESRRRGLYSGAMGYYLPQSGDFDFNVLIRSFLYNAHRAYLSWQVGGAIVFDSVEAEEYEECWVKMRPLLRVLGIE